MLKMGVAEEAGKFIFTTKKIFSLKATYLRAPIESVKKTISSRCLFFLFNFFGYQKFVSNTEKFRFFNVLNVNLKNKK
jgi:hypothetical protein